MLDDTARQYETFGVLTPPSINLSITRRCTWRCIFCYKGCPQNAEMTREELSLALTRILESDIYQVALTGGEPTLHPFWREAAAALKHDPDVMEVARCKRRL